MAKIKRISISFDEASEELRFAIIQHELKMLRKFHTLLPLKDGRHLITFDNGFVHVVADRNHVLEEVSETYYRSQLKHVIR